MPNNPTKVVLEANLPADQLEGFLQAVRTWEGGRPEIDMAIRIDHHDVPVETARAMLARLTPELDIAELPRLTATNTKPDDTVLVATLKDILVRWDRGELYRDAVDKELREAVCHFAKLYLPRDADLEVLTKVAKLAYRFWFKYRAHFIGGTDVTPFWDGIDQLPAAITNAAYEEMKAEDAAREARRGQ